MVAIVPGTTGVPGGALINAPPVVRRLIRVSVPNSLEVTISDVGSARALLKGVKFHFNPLSSVMK